MAKPCMKIVVTLRIDNAHQIFFGGQRPVSKSRGQELYECRSSRLLGESGSGMPQFKGAIIRRGKRAGVPAYYCRQCS